MSLAEKRPQRIELRGAVGYRESTRGWAVAREGTRWCAGNAGRRMLPECWWWRGERGGKTFMSITSIQLIFNRTNLS